MFISGYKLYIRSYRRHIWNSDLNRYNKAWKFRLIYMSHISTDIGLEPLRFKRIWADMNWYWHTHISCISAHKYKRIWTFISVCICTIILTYMSRYKRLYLCISDLLHTQDMDIHISRLYLLKNINIHICLYLLNYIDVYEQI